jgi:hypothetical protein
MMMADGACWANRGRRIQRAESLNKPTQGKRSTARTSSQTEPWAK